MVTIKQKRNGNDSRSQIRWKRVRQKQSKPSIGLRECEGLEGGLGYEARVASAALGEGPGLGPVHQTEVELVQPQVLIDSLGSKALSDYVLFILARTNLIKINNL